MDDQHPLTRAIISGDRDAAIAETNDCLAAGESAQSIVENRMVPAMASVGEDFKNGAIFVPEMLIAARAMKAGMAILEPLLAQAGVKPAYTAIIGTVEGDLHDIGKNLVGMMLKGANIGVVDLGVNVPAAKFVEAVREHNAQLVCLSALLTTTMGAMRKTVAAIHETGLPVMVMIGGAPTTPDFAREIGADGYADDAGSAVDVALSLVR